MREIADHHPPFGGGDRHPRHDRYADAACHQAHDRRQALELRQHGRHDARGAEQPVDRASRRLPRGRGQPRLVPQRPQVNRFDRRPVRARHAQHQLVPDQVVAGESRGVQVLGEAAGPVVHDRHVNRARAHLPQSFPPGRLPQHQGEPRMRAQAAGQRRRERDRRGCDRGRPDPPGRLGGPGGQIGLRLLHHGQDPLRVTGQPPPRVGQLRPSRRAVKQRRANLTFQRGELLRHRRRCVAEHRGGLRDTAASSEFVQEAEPMQVEHK